MSRQLLIGLVQRARPESLLAALAALLVLTMLSGHLYVLKPAVAEYQELGRAEARGSEQLPEAEAAANAAAIALLERELAARRDQLYGEASKVPRDHMESWIIDRLDHLSVRRGVELVSVVPEDVEQVLMFEELPYDVSVKGGYFDLFAWLHDLERELRPLVVKEFKISGKADLGRVAMRLRLVSYRPLGAGA